MTEADDLIRQTARDITADLMPIFQAAITEATQRLTAERDWFREEADRWREAGRAVNDQVERVRALHEATAYPTNAVGVLYCRTCRKKGKRLVEHPCPTAAALADQPATERGGDQGEGRSDG